MGFIDVIKEKAKADKKTIVLPETEDKRTYEAAEAVLREGTANLVLVGSKEEIEKNGAGFDISGATIVDPEKRNDRRAGKRIASYKLFILWCYDGKNGRC